MPPDAMKVIVAPDSLKESLSAAEAAAAIARGLRRADAAVEPVLIPIADGGEGTTEALVEATGGEYRRRQVSGPLGCLLTATWGLSGGGQTAVIEMAEASGLELLAPSERNPMLTSTRGTGELILSALDAGVQDIIVGIGGSATVDGGTGMAHALGVRFLDAAGRAIDEPRGGRLADVDSIDISGLDPRLSHVRIRVACDVTNPLTGPDGAAGVYGPQKGATPEQVEALEAGLANLGRVISRCLGREVAEMPGAGAAGGLGAGLVAFLGAELRSGVQTVMEAVHLRERMAGADLAITAEGRLDAQSAFGKATAGVIGAARQAGVPAVALAGSLGAGYERLYAQGLCAAFAIADGPIDLGAAMARTAELLERAGESVMRLWLAAGGRLHA
jgi:glycerate kinase